MTEKNRRIGRNSIGVAMLPGSKEAKMWGIWQWRVVIRPFRVAGRGNLNQVK